MKDQQGPLFRLNAHGRVVRDTSRSRRNEAARQYGQVMQTGRSNAESARVTIIYSAREAGRMARNVTRILRGQQHKDPHAEICMALLARARVLHDAHRAIPPSHRMSTPLGRTERRRRLMKIGVRTRDLGARICARARVYESHQTRDPPNTTQLRRKSKTRKACRVRSVPIPSVRFQSREKKAEGRVVTCENPNPATRDNIRQTRL